MSFKNNHYLTVFVPSVLLGFMAALQLTGCSDSPPGIPSETAGAGGEGGKEPISAGGEAGDASPLGDAGEAAGGTADGHPEGGSTSNGGDAGASPGAGTGGTFIEAVIPPTCTFHTDTSLSAGGTAGAGGAASGGIGGGSGGTSGGSAGTGGSGAGPNVTLQVSPFVGSYLADATGRTLYTYGNDLPGDCQTPPVSNCITDCLISWPIFPASARVLAAGLDDAAFGAIHRDDIDAWQMTYNGWPIYYYKNDLKLGDVAGQGKAKTWHIVEKKLPSVFIMVKPPSTTKYLADESGHTLYVSAADVAGTASADPVSSCTGECLTTFVPFHEQNFSVVTSLAIASFGSFVRPGSSSVQLAYKGQPLYRAATDLKSGDMNGISVTGFTAAVP